MMAGVVGVCGCLFCCAAGKLVVSYPWFCVLWGCSLWVTLR